MGHIDDVVDLEQGERIPRTFDDGTRLLDRRGVHRAAERAQEDGQKLRMACGDPRERGKLVRATPARRDVIASTLERLGTARTPRPAAPAHAPARAESRRHEHGEPERGERIVDPMQRGGIDVVRTAP